MKDYSPSIQIIQMDLGDATATPVAALIENFPKDEGADIFTSDERAIPVISDKTADRDKKYVAWGSDNDLPNQVISRANMSPYVSPSLKHLIDSTYSAGIKAWYVYYVYRNGEMIRKQIDFEAAGDWLRNRIRELKEEQEVKPKRGGAFLSTDQAAAPKDHSEEIARLEKDLKTWEASWAFWETFTEENNLPLWLYEQASDANYFWNWFPVLELEVGDPRKRWNPKVAGLSYLESTCTRKGVMDEYGKIHYVVYSRSFGQDEPTNADDTDNIMRQVVLDALDPEKALVELRKRVRKEAGMRAGDRTLRYVVPMKVPTPGKFYYSFPSYWTIFKSRIFQYMLTMFARRAVMMQNATMFKYIIHINKAYLEYEYSQRGAETDDDKKKIYTALISSIESFIKEPKNAGKAMIAMEETINGQAVKWVEIETIESPMKGSDVKEDIAEIANVMLFAQGIHPQTVGAIPGKDKMASGTEARELNTLQQLYLYPLKSLLLYPLYIIKGFNKLDKHLYFDIPVHVLTTLDKNKQGVEEMNN